MTEYKGIAGYEPENRGAKAPMPGYVVKSGRTLTRQRSSRNGNPRYLVTFADGTSYRTGVDSSCAYGIGNSELDNVVQVKIERGCIVDIRPLNLQQLDTERLAGHADYPHVPGYLIDCAACEATCHCNVDAVREGRNSECVYAGH